MTVSLVDEDESKPPPMPRGFDAVAKRAWQRFTGPDGWDFDHAGLVLLESLCRSLSLEARLQAHCDKAERLSGRGSRMNEVELAELGSLIKIRALINATIKQLALDVDEVPADEDGSFRGSPTSAKAAKAAMARWDRRFA